MRRAPLIEQPTQKLGCELACFLHMPQRAIAYVMNLVLLLYWGRCVTLPFLFPLVRSTFQRILHIGEWKTSLTTKMPQFSVEKTIRERDVQVRKAETALVTAISTAWVNASHDTLLLLGTVDI